MKNLQRLLALLVFILMLSVLAGCDNQEQNDRVVYYKSEDNLQTYTLENEYLRFTMDGTTSYFTLEDKQSGEIWHSVPENGSEDTMADQTMKKWLQSTMIVTYTVQSGLNTIFDNYSNSIANGTFQITQQEDTVRVDYLLSENVRVYMIPEMVTEERFNTLISGLEKNKQSTVKGTYRKLDPENPPAGEDLDALMEKYPLLSEGVIYVQRDGVADYRYEQVEELFAQQGYTQEDYEKDQLITEGEGDILQFNVSVEYSLDGDSLAARVPGDSLRCPGDFQMTKLQVLPYFGAGSTEDEGFLLIPDGGGAIIDFNNRKGTSGSVSSKVYGWDSAKARSKMISDNAVSFPVYGIAKNNGYLLAVIEGGAGEATLESNVSGNRNSYNTITPSFEVIHGELVYVSSKSNAQVMVFEKDRQYEDLSIRFFAGSGNSYVSMAHTYRQYLMDTYPHLQPTETQGLSVAVELIGAVDHITQVMGIPMQTVLPATTYSEAYAISQQLMDMGISDLHLKYSGAVNGGMKQTGLNKVSMVSALGSDKERKALADLFAETNHTLYLGAYGSQVMDTGIFDGFNSAQDAIRNTLSDVVEATPYHTVTYMEIKNKPYFILNADATATALKKLSEAAENNGFGGVGLEDVGARISSDFNKDSATSRDAMARLQSALLEQMEQKVMISGGNAYAAPYADMIVGMDLHGSGYDLVSRQVPFYQIALHGLVNYTGQAVNMAQNYEKNLLKSVETGSGLYFLFAEISAAELQMTDYTVYSGNEFATWRDTVQSLYGQLNADLGHTVGQMITDHQYLNDFVTVTVYEDGTRVYVNYGAEDYKTENGTVKAMNYLAVGGTNNG